MAVNERRLSFGSGRGGGNNGALAEHGREPQQIPAGIQIPTEPTAQVLGDNLHVRLAQHLDVIPRNVHDFQIRKNPSPETCRIGGRAPRPLLRAKQEDRT